MTTPRDAILHPSSVSRRPWFLTSRQPLQVRAALIGCASIVVAYGVYEILGLVGREGAGQNDLLRLARRGRMLAWAAESQ